MFKRLKGFITVKTIRGQIALGFIGFTFFFALLFVSLEIYFHYSFVRRYEYMIRNTVPSRYFCSVAENCVSKSMIFLDNFLITQSPYYKVERKQIWEQTYKSALDSLIIYTRDWQDNVASSLIYDIRIKGNRLKAEQDRIEEQNIELAIATEEEAGRIDYYKKTKKEQIEKLNLLVEDINSVLDLLINLQQEEINRIESQIRYDEQNLLYYISPFALIVILVSGYWLAFSITVSILKRLKLIRETAIVLEKGNLPDKLPTALDETRVICEQLNSLMQQLRTMQEFAVEVGIGHLDTPFKAFNGTGEVGKAFLQMQESLKNLAEKDKKTNWVVLGITRFVEIVRGKGENLRSLSEIFVVELVRYIGAVQAGIYIAEKDAEDKTMLHLTAFFAYDLLKQKQCTIEVGEGLVGETFQEKRIIHLKSIPANYLSVVSGLGGAEPNRIILIPMQTSEAVVGVIEIASFQDFEEHHVEFLAKIAENFATEVLAVQNATRNKNLLIEAQRNAEQLRTQEEEMRQNVEELQATQEEMIRKEAEISRILQESQARESVMKKYTQNYQEVKAQLEFKTKENEALWVELENLKMKQ